MSAFFFGRASTLLIVPFLLFGLVAVSCDDEADEPSDIGLDEPIDMDAEVPPIEGTLKGEDVLEPGDAGVDLENAVVGESVNVQAEFAEYFGPHALVVGGGPLSEFALVLVPAGVQMPTGLGPDAEGHIEVTGEVIQVALATLEGELREPLQDDELGEVEDYAGERAILASNLQFVPADPGGAVNVPAVGETGVLAGTVSEVITARLFILEGDDGAIDVFGDDVLAVVPSSLTLPDDLVEGAIVSITGTIVEVDVASIESEHFSDEPFDEDTATDLEAYEGEIGIIASELTALAE